jgi:PAS domain S-box-containing protein
MRLRLILGLLCLMAVSSALMGGHLYYGALRRAAIDEAERQALVRVESLKKQIVAFISENRRSVQTLARLEPLTAYLNDPRSLSLAQQVNALLDGFQQTLGVEVCYLMDHTGLTLASSNRSEPDSFVGQNFAFRPYFREAMAGAGSNYLALGVTSGRRGVYHSFPILNPADGSPLGLAVVKASVEKIEKELHLGSGERLMVVDPQGMVFVSNHRQWLFKTLSPLTADQAGALADSRQFGAGPWSWTGLTIEDQERKARAEDQHFRLYGRQLDGYPGWQVLYLINPDALLEAVAGPLLRFTGPAVMLTCILVGGIVLLLYRKASREIHMRQEAESALRQSDERYRSLYHNTPAMLHSVDPQGRLVSVSDYWAEALGYSRQEVIGRRITDLMTPASRRFAEQTVMPAFFKTGFCNDVPYQFIKKNGQIIEVALSAIAERDPQGRIVRSLSVSIDVTEHKRAQAALQQAKEQLDRHSKDLERLVDQRTDQLRRLSGGILLRQEKERAAIARELHDELGQVLTALRMEAVWLAGRLKAADPPAADRALTMVGLIDKNIDDVRGLAVRLRPGVLDDLGLVDALEWLTSDFERRTGIICLFDHDSIAEMGEVVATAAYRIVQEALTNAARHAEASQVRVALRLGEDGLTVSVVDNGKGFDPTSGNAAEGLGVAGMMERAGLIGGSLTLTAKPGSGATVCFRIPRAELNR